MLQRWLHSTRVMNRESDTIIGDREKIDWEPLPLPLAPWRLGGSRLLDVRLDFPGVFCYDDSYNYRNGW